MIWRGFIVIAVLAAAGLTLFARRHLPDKLPLSAKPSAPQPGYYMLDAKITQTGPDGLPLYQMSARRIQQNPVDQSFRLDTLQFVYHSGDAHDWTLTATNGFVPPDSRTVDLRGNVQIVGQPAAGSQAAIVRTSRLTVDTQTSIATTRERVEVVWGDRHLSAVGLWADLKAQRVRLESAVHGRFVR